MQSMVNMIRQRWAFELLKYLFTSISVNKCPRTYMNLRGEECKGDLSG
jgi:hypothetical protein